MQKSGNAICQKASSEAPGESKRFLGADGVSDDEVTSLHVLL